MFAQRSAPWAYAQWRQAWRQLVQRSAGWQHARPHRWLLARRSAREQCTRRRRARRLAQRPARQMHTRWWCARGLCTGAGSIGCLPVQTLRQGRSGAMHTGWWSPEGDACHSLSEFGRVLKGSGSTCHHRRLCLRRCRLVVTGSPPTSARRAACSATGSPRWAERAPQQGVRIVVGVFNS